MVHLQPTKDFRAEDAVEEGALDESEVRLYVITVEKLDILCWRSRSRWIGQMGNHISALII